MSNIKPVSQGNTVILTCHEIGPRLVKIEGKYTACWEEGLKMQSERGTR